MKKLLCVLVVAVALLSGCKPPVPVVLDPDKPGRTLKEYIDSTYLLQQLPSNYYGQYLPTGSFSGSHTNRVTLPGGVQVQFQPLGYADTLLLQYTHIYSSQCVYHINDSVWKFAEVAFPNTCLTRQPALAKVRLQNTGRTPKTIHLRLFYQNTSYWYTTDTAISTTESNYLENYYGASAPVSVLVPGLTDTTVQMAYSIGMDPKGEYPYDPSKSPARPGNYEFMLVADEGENRLLKPDLNLQTTNPFAEARLRPGYRFAYTPPSHFKFVFLEEFFDGTNDLDPAHIYVPKHKVEKKLCDTCSNWFRAVINENWNVDDYFTGFVSKVHFVKAEYGSRRENYRVDSTGITLTMPASKRGEYQKTWGEFIFGPAFQYGHVIVRAKLAPMFTKLGYPTGIVHNIWLYQRDYDPVDTTQPFSHLVNGNGVQPYEIDFEVWSCLEGVNTMWDDNAFINYSIVDYMRKPDVKLRPGEYKQMGNYKAERLNNRQAGIPGENLGRDFFYGFHTYEMYWTPQYVRFLVDGQEKAYINPDMAAIPDRHMYLWIGSPIYQDGTYYAQSNIPFTLFTYETIVDYIKIE